MFPVTQSEARPGPRWLTSNLVVLTAISFFQDAASELLYPLLPLLVTGALAAPPVILGVIEGLADATAGLTKYLAGRWSDRHGRKPFIGAGYGLAALGKVLVAAATACRWCCSDGWWTASARACAAPPRRPDRRFGAGGGAGPGLRLPSDG